MANPFLQYKQQAVSTMSGGEQITALYGEVVKNLNVAITLFNNGDDVVAKSCTLKCRGVFDYLISVLDFKYPVSNHLFKLYNFFKQETLYADSQKSSQPLAEILPLITDLRETWVEAQRLSHLQK